MFLRKERIIGIDLGTACAKAVALEINRRPKVIVVRDFVIHPLEVPGQPLGEVLPKLLRKLRTRCRECAVAAWPKGARFHFFESDKRLSTPAVRQMANRDNQFGPHEAGEDYVFDCDKLKRAKSPERTATYLGCGIPRSQMQALHAAFRELGYHVRLLQLTPVSIFNAFAMAHEDVIAEEPYLLVDIGKRHTTLVGGSKGEMNLMRVLDMGWEQVADSLSSDFGINCHDELQKLPLEDPVIRDAAYEATHALADQIMRTFDYLQMSTDVPRPVRIFISGPVSSESVVVRVLCDHLGVTMVQWNPLRQGIAKNRALKGFKLLNDLSRLPAAAGAAFQCLL